MRYFVLCFLAGLASITSAQKHVFYLHGRIIEVLGPNAVDASNGYGAYKYYDILDSLRKNNWTVISEARPADTQAWSYAKKVSHQVDSLLKKGVKASDITIIGASKGAMIAIMTSSILRNKQIGFVLMGICSDDLAGDDQLNLHGRILSIYEKSDAIGSSCHALKNKSTGISNYKEIAIDTGLKHGFLYRPLKEWLIPAREWIKG